MIGTNTAILIVIWAIWLVFVIFFNKGERSSGYGFDMMPAFNFGWTLIVVLIITIFLT